MEMVLTLVSDAMVTDAMMGFKARGILAAAQLGLGKEKRGPKRGRERGSITSKARPPFPRELWSEGISTREISLALERTSVANDISKRAIKIGRVTKRISCNTRIFFFSQYLDSGMTMERTCTTALNSTQ